MNGAGAVPAGLGRRAAAFVVDVALVGAVAAAAALAARACGEPVAFVVLVALAASCAGAFCQWLLRARRGWSVGQLFLDLATVDDRSGAPVGMVRSAQRSAVVLAGGLVVGVGALVVLLSPAFDRSGRRIGWHDEVAGTWVVRRRGGGQPAHRAGPDVEPARPRRPAPSARPAPTGEVPVLAFGLMPELERTRPAPPRPDERGEETYRPVRAELELSDGSWQVVQGTVLVGRNPIAGVGQSAIRVPDPLRSVSRTHLRLVVGRDGLSAEDLGSTNGTLALLPGGRQVRCVPGTPVPVPSGTVLSLGDCWIRVAGTSAERSAFPDATIRR